MLRSCNVELLAGGGSAASRGSGGGSIYYIIYAAVALSQSTRTEFSFILPADEDDRQLTAGGRSRPASFLNEKGPLAVQAALGSELTSAISIPRPTCSSDQPGRCCRWSGMSG